MQKYQLFGIKTKLSYKKTIFRKLVNDRNETK